MRIKASPIYKWYLLIIATLIQIFVVSITWNGLPVLFTEIARDLNLSIVQIGIFFSMAPLALCLLALPSGLIGSKLGIRQVIIIGTILTALTGGLRGISPNFITLTVLMFLFGASLTVVFVNMPRVTRLWFPQHQLGLSNGIIQSGMGIGTAVGAAVNAVLLSPLLGGWRNVLFLYTAITSVLGIIWWQSVKGYQPKIEPGHNADIAESDESFREILSKVLRSKNIWLISIAFIGMPGAYVGTIHYLPIYLENIGLSKVTIGGIISTLSWAAVAGNIILPAISDRVGSRKLILIPSLLIGVIYIYLLPQLTGGALWAAAIIGGFFFPGCFSLPFAAVLESKDINLKHSGTAIGLLLSIGNLGAFMSPIIGDIIATGNPTLPFTFWASVPLISVVFILLSRETSHKRNKG